MRENERKGYIIPIYAVTSSPIRGRSKRKGEDLRGLNDLGERICKMDQAMMSVSHLCVLTALISLNETSRADLPFEKVVYQSAPVCSDDDRMEINHVLSRAWELCGAIHSWDFNTVVVYKRDMSERAPAEYLDIARSVCKYDGLSDKLRCDGSSMGRSEQLKLVVRDEGILQYDSLNKGSLLLRKDTRFADRDRFALFIMDPRCVSLGRPEHQVLLSDPYKSSREWFTGSTAVDLVQLDPRFTEVRWMPVANVMTSLVFDREQNFAPVLYGVRQREGARREGSDGDYLLETCVRTVWKEVGGLLVPTGVTSHDFVTSAVFSVEFSWNSVNQRISDEEFTIKGMNLPAGTKVFTAVSEGSVEYGCLDDEGEIHENDFAETVHKTVKINKPNFKWWRIYSLVGVNGVAFAVLVFVLIVRYRRSTSMS